MRRSTGLPTLVFKCAECKARRKETRLGEFDLGPDGPSQTHHTVGAWTAGPDGPDSVVHLHCGKCGHTPHLRREQIIQGLRATHGKKTVYL